MKSIKFGGFRSHMRGQSAICLLAIAFLMFFNPKWAQPQAASPTLSNPMVHTPPQVLNGAATLVQHYDPSQMLRLAFALTPPHPDQERQLIDALHDKNSPQFHQFLTAEQWNARFSPSAADEQQLVDWATSQGLTISNRYPNRLLVDVVAQAGVIEKALNIKINNYSIGSTTFYSNDRDPSLPAALANVVQSVEGLNSLENVRPAHRGAKPVARPDYLPGPVAATEEKTIQANGDSTKLPASLAAAGQSASQGPQITNGGYDPTDLYSSQAYNFAGLRNLGHCCNPLGNSGGSPADTSIAIASFADLNYNDVAGFHDQYPYLAYNIQKIYVDGTYTCSGFDDGCLEVTLDTEWSLAMSNSFGSYVDTAKVWIYEGANYNNSTVIDLYNQMLTDGHARVFSTSWDCAENQSYSASGDCFDSTMSARDNVLRSMVGQGWTLVAASGDEGATATWCEDKLGVFFPASDPNVVAAGGTTLELYSGPVFSSEVGWTGGTSPGSCGSNNGGSTGGFSSYWGTPSYQSGMGFGSRAVPDISLNASVGENMYFAAGGGLFPIGGTSIVAPELAGFFAQENSYLLSLGSVCGAGSTACAPMGNANYYLYDEGKYQSAAHFPYYDITQGCNSNDITAAYGLTPYCAGVGFDEVTGWGSANVLQLAWAINWFDAAAFGSPSISFSGPTTGKWYNTDQVVSWNVIDNSGDSAYPPTGVAGFTQGWDSIPADSYSAARPSSNDSFFNGPQYPNRTDGCLDFAGSSCAGSVSQGCHTAHVQAWNNMGKPSGDVTYGPICYDTIAPTVAASLSGTLSGSVYSSAVHVTLSATDSGSGVKATYYRLNSGSWTAYSSAVLVSGPGAQSVEYYSTDVAGNSSAIGLVSFTIESPTKTTVTASANSVVYGTSVSLTADVVATFGGTVAGTVTFRDGVTTLGTATLAGGKATLSTTAISGGTTSITALYNGDADFLSSTSAALSETIKLAATTTTIASSLNPSTFDSTVTFTATVKSATTGSPTGQVTFKVDGIAVGTYGVSAGKASFSGAGLPAGSHTIVAVYDGSVDFSTSTSVALTQVVDKAATTTTLTSSLNPSTANASVTFTALVKSTTTLIPTGTVTFKDGTTTIGTGSLSAGKATFSTKSLAVGSHSITAIYVGSVDYLSSTSPVLTQKVN